MSVSDAMKLHLQGTLTVGVFLTITAKDGDVLRVWNGTRDKIVDGETFIGYPLAPSKLQAANGLKADNLEITSVYSGLFTAATLRAKKWQNARVEYRVLNYKDFSMGYAERRVTFLGKTDVGKRGAKVELLSLSSKLNQATGLTCTKECNVDEFADDRCGKSVLPSIRLSGAGTSAINGDYAPSGVHDGELFYCKPGGDAFHAAVTWYSTGAYGVYNVAGNLVYESDGAFSSPAGRTFVPSGLPGDSPGPTVTEIPSTTEQGYALKVDAHISASVLNPQQFTVAFDEDIYPADLGITDAPDAFFKRGKIRFTSGSNSGLEALILGNEGNALTLYLPLPYTPEIGDAIELTTGCDRTIKICRDKFANAERNRGFFCLPGRSKVIKIPE